MTAFSCSTPQGRFLRHPGRHGKISKRNLRTSDDGRPVDPQKAKTQPKNKTDHIFKNAPGSTWRTFSDHANCGGFRWCHRSRGRCRPAGSAFKYFLFFFCNGYDATDVFLLACLLSVWHVYAGIGGQPSVTLGVVRWTLRRVALSLFIFFILFFFTQMI